MMSCVRAFDLQSTESNVKELRKLTEQDNFWNSSKAQDVSRELAREQSKLDRNSKLLGEFQDIETLAEMLADYEDEELEKEFYSRSEALLKAIENYKEAKVK